MTYIWATVNFFLSVVCWRSSANYFNEKQNFLGWYLLVASAANAASAAAMIF
jgi:hypothetical protein